MTSLDPPTAEAGVSHAENLTKGLPDTDALPTGPSVLINAQTGGPLQLRHVIALDELIRLGVISEKEALEVVKNWKY